MKRLLVSSLLLLAGAAPGQPLPASAPALELLANPGFNDDADGNGLPDHWSTSEKQIRWLEKVPFGRDYEIESQPGQYVLATQDLRLKPGATYTLTLRCRGEGGALAGALILHGAERPTREMSLLWNVEPTAEYGDYARTFVAPDPVARLYLYNVAKTKGTVAYDQVSLHEGGPDRLIINRLSFPPIDRAADAPPATPHIDWASPLMAGPVKALVTLRSLRCLRQVIELSQRLDLDYDVIDTGVSGESCVSETGLRATQRVDSSYYEVYVVPSRVQGVLARTIRERVEAGAGLVLIEGFGRLGDVAPTADMVEAGPDHELRQGIPWDAMPEKILSSVQVGRLGKGRVVRLEFPLAASRVWGLLPSEMPLQAYRVRQFEYWEWWHALLARCLVWAAGRETTVSLRSVRADARSLTLAVTGTPTAARARVILRSARELRFDGPALRTPATELPVSPEGALVVTIPPELPAGAVIADVVALSAAGEVLNWGSFTADCPQAVRLSGLLADRGAYAPDDALTLRVEASVVAPCEVELETRLIDACGRLVSRTSAPHRLGAGTASLQATLAIDPPLCVHHKAFVRLLVAGREQDSAWVPVQVPALGSRLAAQDFTVLAWSPGTTHPTEAALYADRLRELGLNAEFAADPYLMSERGLPGGGYIGGMGMFRETTWSADGVRSRCLSDPTVIQEYTEKARAAALAQQDQGLFAVGITDEAFLTSRHTRHEVCFGPHCQARYRDWLKARYGTLAALNAEWGTTHADWEQVGGVRSEEVRGTENYAPFVDFRQFMTEVWIAACRGVAAAYHEVSPATPVGHTNTFGADPFTGNDYARFFAEIGFGWGQEYSEAIKGSAHKALFDIWRSFCDTAAARQARAAQEAAGVPFFNYGWIGYDRRVAAAHYEPWWLSLHGSRGVSWFAANAIDTERGVSWALVHPSLSFTPYSRAAQEALADLRGGCGKLLMEYERETPRIGILWSYPSMLVAWCESAAVDPEPSERDGTDSYGTHFRSAFHIRQHLNELQLDYAYVAPEQILSGDVLKDYPLLFLPFSVAVSQALLDRLAAYVEAGGLLVGDLRCLRTDEHGRPLADAAALRRLFGVARSGAITYAAGIVRLERQTEGLGAAGVDLAVYGRETLTPAGATALGAHATGEPAVLVQPRGKGLTVYLNFSLSAYDRATLDLIEQITQRAGIQRTVRVESLVADAPPRCYERNTFRRGPVVVHGLIRDHRRCTDGESVRVRFGAAAHVYDVRARHYLGLTASVETRVMPGEAVLYACLPYRVEGVSVGVPEEAVTGTELIVKVAVSAAGSSPSDHVVHLELCDPAGRVVTPYTRNLLVPAGRLTTSIPLALNDPVGPWTVRVRDVLTGTTAEGHLAVLAAGP